MHNIVLCDYLDAIFSIYQLFVLFYAKHDIAQCRAGSEDDIYLKELRLNNEDYEL